MMKTMGLSIRSLALAGVFCTLATTPAVEPPDDRTDGSRDDPADVRAAFVQAFQDLSADDVAALFTEQGIMVRGSNPLVGRDAIHEAMASMFGGMSGPNPLAFTPDESVSVPGMAMEAGFYGPEGGGAAGRYIMVFQHNDGAWLISWMRWYSA